MASKRARPEPWRCITFGDTEKTIRPSGSGGDVPGCCPPKVEATFYAILNAVAEAPPPAFSGGGKWEAMHDAMAGYYEARDDGPQRNHYRLFCLLERGGADLGLGGPSIVVITGMMKPFWDQVLR